jgi:hypothetical protein
MRYADEYSQVEFDKRQRAAGRPANSPGWGMLAAVKSGEYVSERDPTVRTTITAARTYVSPDYWLAGERPELFMPADKRDLRIAAAHSRNLSRARAQLERGRPTSSRRREQGDRLRLPGQPFRLPPRAPFKLPRPAGRKALP